MKRGELEYYIKVMEEEQNPNSKHKSLNAESFGVVACLFFAKGR
jgi:hypothetical protein